MYLILKGYARKTNYNLCEKGVFWTLRGPHPYYSTAIFSVFFLNKSLLFEQYIKFTKYINMP